jgi:hypothetical protein
MLSLGAAGKIAELKKFNGLVGTRTYYLPVYSPAPPPSTLSRVPDKLGMSSRTVPSASIAIHLGT